MSLLTVRGLRTDFPTEIGPLRAVEGVDVSIEAGECLGVVGESGSGKSVTFQSILGLVRPPGRVVGGQILFEGRDLAQLSDREMQRIRGREIALTMQDALTALNPVLTVEAQIAEVLEGGRAARRWKCLDVLKLVGIPEPARRLAQYPHEMSGGMRQRVMIATALASGPKLLIADEPTSALDVTIQAQVLALISELRRKLGMAVVLITHDLSIVAQYCDRIAVMYAGQIVEEGLAKAVIRNPRHPYTRGLLDALPRIEDPDRPLKAIEGQVPDLFEAPTECRFLPRCPRAAPECRVPIALQDGVRCVRPL